MVTKFAGPFSDTWRCSISPRSRLRLRPARRAALTMTLMRAECSISSVYQVKKRPNAVIDAGLGALRPRQRQAGSFGAEPFARAGVDFGAILRAQLGQRLVELRIAFTRGFGDHMPFQPLDLVHRCAHSRDQNAREAVLGDRAVLSRRLSQQRHRGGLVLRRAGAVEERDGIF